MLNVHLWQFKTPQPRTISVEERRDNREQARKALNQKHAQHQPYIQEKAARRQAMRAAARGNSYCICHIYNHYRGKPCNDPPQTSPPCDRALHRHPRRSRRSRTAPSMTGPGNAASTGLEAASLRLLARLRLWSFLRRRRSRRWAPTGPASPSLRLRLIGPAAQSPGLACSIWSCGGPDLPGGSVAGPLPAWRRCRPVPSDSHPKGQAAPSLGPSPHNSSLSLCPLLLFQPPPPPRLLPGQLVDLSAYTADLH
jgi:hypothetical protein